MPRCYVPDNKLQRDLMSVRLLLSPGGAAHRLHISRQAVMESASRPGGRLLMWVFGPEPGTEKARHPWAAFKEGIGDLVAGRDSDIPRRYGTYVDFGERRGLLDGDWDTRIDPSRVTEWQDSDPEQLLVRTRELIEQLNAMYGPAEEDDEETMS